MSKHNEPKTMKLYINCILIFCVVLFSLSCKQAEQPANEQPEKSVYYNKSYSSNLIGSLSDDLETSGYTASDIAVIIAGAKTSIASEGLHKSTDLSLVAPTVLKGTETSLAQTSITDKTTAVEDILGSILSTAGSLNTSASSSKRMSVSGRLNQALPTTNLTTLLQNLTQTAIENLDEAGVSSSEINELESIVDLTKYSPSIDTIYFPDTSSSNYWSSTTSANYTVQAWEVDFSSGSISDMYKIDTNWYVRCVR